VANIKPADIGNAITEQLTIYSKDIVRKINAAGEDAVKKLVKKTKATAPKRTGSYRKNIASKKVEDNGRGAKYVWYVKEPDHRLTHLLVHGHEKRNGGRVKGDPFLANACDEVLPEFEKAVEEAVAND
jgi:hypothetical protein